MTQTPERQLKTAEARLAAALALREAGDLVGAVGLLRELLGEESGFVRGWIELGRTLRRLGEREAALEAFGEAERLEPKHLQSRIEGAIELRELGNLHKATQKLNNILQICPQNTRVLFELGEVYRIQKKFKKAISKYEKALAVDSTYKQAQLRSMQVHRELGHWEIVENHWKKVVHNNELDRFQACVQLGMLERYRGLHSRAIGWFEKALENKLRLNQKLQVQIYIAEELRDLNKLEAAQSLSELLVEQNSCEPSTFIVLASIFQRKKDFESAIKWYKRALNINPNHISCKLNLAKNLYYVGRAEDALKLLEVARKDDYSFLALQLCKIEILQDNGSFSDAETHLLELRKIFPSEPHIIFQLACLKSTQGNLEESLSWFNKLKKENISNKKLLSTRLKIIEKLIQLDFLNEAYEEAEGALFAYPNHQKVLAFLVKIYIKKVDFSPAIEICNQILSKNPYDFSIHLDLVYILSNTNRVAEAIDRLESLYNSDCKDWRIPNRLGELAQASGDWLGAKNWYEVAISICPSIPAIHTALAEVVYRQGDVDLALMTLHHAQRSLPNAYELMVKEADLSKRRGYPEEALALLNRAAEKFYNTTAIEVERCSLYLELGKFSLIGEALKDRQCYLPTWRKKAEQILGNVALRQFNFKKAECHFRTAISLNPPLTSEYQKLAQTLMMQGHLDDAWESLKQATDELLIKISPGASGTPLKGHLAAIVNQFRANPSQLKKVQRSLDEDGAERLRALASVIVEEPDYVGSSLLLLAALRQQGFFKQITDQHNYSNSLRKKSTNTIPRRIAQFWNDPEPPADVKEVMSSWKTKNPDYEYTLFSRISAIEFLKQYYDRDTVHAFLNCEHPATQADFFRLAYLNKVGGFYADVDDRCLESIDPIVRMNNSLVVYQEEFSLGNSFLGCIPGQIVIRIAFEKAVKNLKEYNAESPWFKTGPGLLSSAFCIAVLPYICSFEEKTSSEMLVLELHELKHFVWCGTHLSYKSTSKSWYHKTYNLLLKS